MVRKKSQFKITDNLYKSKYYEQNNISNNSAKPFPNIPHKNLHNEQEKWIKLLSQSFDEGRLVKPPYYFYFKKYAKENGLSLPLVLGLANGLSYFEPRYGIGNCIGIMIIKWPEPATRLGISDYSVLKNPARNIEAGCRYLASLIQQNNDNVVKAILMYNFQSSDFRGDENNDKNFIFLKNIRKHVEAFINGTYKKKQYFARYQDSIPGSKQTILPVI